MGSPSDRTILDRKHIRCDTADGNDLRIPDANTLDKLQPESCIIMFEYAETLRREEGKSAKEAAFLSGKRRMRPIFLTSATTALGVVPMIISRSTLWMPMGVIICFGTVLSLVLIVTVLPVAYWKIYSVES